MKPDTIYQRASHFSTRRLARARTAKLSTESAKWRKIGQSNQNFQRLCVKSRVNKTKFFVNQSKAEINIEVVLTVGVILWTKEISYCESLYVKGLQNYQLSKLEI